MFLLPTIRCSHLTLLNSGWNSLSVPQSAAEKELAILNWSSYQTDWDTKRLIRLYYLSFLASQVPCNALCAIDFYFSLSSPFLPGSLSPSPSLHLHQHLLSSEMSCRSDGCWAGSIRESNLGRLIHTSARTHTHTHARRHITDTHRHTPLLCCTLACLPPLSSICIYFTKWILLFFYPPPPFFLSMWLRIINVSDCVQDVYVSNFSFNFGLTFFLLSSFTFVMFQSFRGINAVFPHTTLKPLANQHILAWGQRFGDDRIWHIVSWEICQIWDQYSNHKF